MADVNRGKRPLSPFMIGPYYRPQITSISSILVRITALASLGTVTLLVWWLLAAATSDAAFAFIDGLLTSLIGDLVLFLASWAIFYHMLGRLRHVVWDFGYCLDIKISEKLGWGMFAGATVLALIAAIVL
ncbi:MAG: succinate dehydrogenase, cytochrome b556 subunit [Pseudomonadota bacterium]|jgi:succinate dehydrogenase / fumarate reductase cytochrome b subunit|uniref:succinate dehydrogenase, cytochrome b556 subunit n=1 Tax=Thalassovita sp. TaxID=1979401 RepID=UPI002AB1DD3D|nr:succinate dehydrogenase, cytochrome b556 subunit [Thalassovita sp.]MEC7964330.1 succinate dehydrogenase, cytochrome b556 subunit [Pseudomonadota bacterium]MEC8039409.1 succinate dehydrogenase, cytochrome b556 subunit [Pseudomonadota bacterium]MEC8294991.1 succinate dehydrogenase, cytochrome b556 subunit [Pseudomonadota bacterium]